MARTQQKLNNQSSEVIEKNILQQDPEGFADSNIVIAKQVPPPVELKRFIFLNGRDPGVALHFHYHSGNCPLKQYTLYHGHEHELPQEIIDHLENCAEPNYGYKPGPEGHPEMFIKSKKFIFQCKELKKAI